MQQAKQQIDEAKAQVSENENSMAANIPELQQQLEYARQEIAVQEAAYNEQLAVFNEKKEKAEIEIQDGEKEIAEKQTELNELSAPVYTVNDRKDNPGYKQYLENSQRIDVLSNVFPVFLFGIAALVSLTTMTRFVDEQRINMGTLKALGYSNTDIKKKFVVYGLVPSSLGAAVGTLLGHTLLPKVIFNAYAATSTFSEIILLASFKYSLIAILTAVICTVVPAYLLASGELREHTASLLLPKPPKAGARILLEKIKPIWNRMSFTYKVTARNLFRYKKRMLMTIIGVAGCTALLITGFGIRDSLSGIVDEQFGELINYDLITVYDDEKTINQELTAPELTEKIKDSTDIRYEEVSAVAGTNQDKQSITVLAADNLIDFSTFVKLRNRTSGQTIELSDNGVVLSEKLAELLNVKKGDQVTIQDDDGIDRKILVSDVTEMYMGHYMFMNRVAYQSIFEKDMVLNGKLITLNDQSPAASDEVATELMNVEGVRGIVQSKELSRKIDAVMGGLNNVIVVLIVCAILLAVVVIYNLTNINVSERIRELSTIKVLGFYDNEVTLYIYRETIILSIVGILVGYVIGFFLHSFIMVSLPPDEAMFKPELMPMNFILSAGITLAITFVIMGVMHRKIKKVNMLDALKSVD
ncbi:FtsX-like permease family protein [uncultured Enterococcus sp.]|uniref:FtsX-like permease family protein n=1 Tax=uncultured Enterococcus sp. TaxID=167972 RepID=UPI002AA70745|nr:FtsX-like permease family protein [uncultured Enterococcus sp.]